MFLLLSHRGEGRGGYRYRQQQPKKRDSVEQDLLARSAKPSGVLWKCPFTSKHRDCVRVDDLPTADSTQSLIEAGGQWLGVAVHSQGPGKTDLLLRGLESNVMSRYCMNAGRFY